MLRSAFGVRPDEKAADARGQAPDRLFRAASADESPADDDGSRMTLNALRHGLILVSAIVTIAWTATPSWAQGRDARINDALVSASSIDREQQATLEAFVAQWRADLQSEDATTRQRARDALLDPLTRSGVTPSRAFRRAYDDAFEGAIEGLVRHDELGVAICAMQVAGAMGTQSGFTALMTALEDERPGARYTAALQMGRLLGVADEGGAVIRGQQIDEGLEALRDLLATDEQILVALGATRALDQPQGDLRVRALTAQCEGLSAQIRSRRQAGALAQEEILVFLTTITEIRTAILQNASTLATQPEFAKAAAVLGGQTMSATLDLVERSRREDLPGEVSREQVVTLAIVAEVVATLAHDSLLGETVDARIEQEVRRALDGRPNQLRSVVESWVGPNGRLTRPPYDRPAADFG